MNTQGNKILSPSLPHPPYLQYGLGCSLLAILLVLALHLDRVLADAHHKLVLLVLLRHQPGVNVGAVEPKVALEAVEEDRVRGELAGLVAQLRHTRVLDADLVEELEGGWEGCGVVRKLLVGEMYSTSYYSVVFT